MRFLTKQKVPLKFPRAYIRNFIYKSIKDTEFDWIHDAKAYKHFCFSNFFPFDSSKNYLEENQSYNLIISSPIKQILKYISLKLIRDEKLILGSYQFHIQELKFLNELDLINYIITATPIIVRIPKSLFEKYNISSKKVYEFWDQSKYLNIFLEAVIKNGVRRFNNYIAITKRSLKKLDETNLPLEIFQKLKFKKTVYGWDKHFIGTLWEFEVNPKWQRSAFIKYLYDSGLGERNASSGSGFVNVLRSK